VTSLRPTPHGYDNQALAGIFRGADLGEIALVEQRELQGARLGEVLDLG
jgi:hypothetical protein